MEDQYILYFDSGTTNTRLYVLNQEMDIILVNKKSIGSKDSAIVGSNKILIEGMKELYDKTLKEMKISENHVKEIFASGMVTSPYGLKEIPHQVLPITIHEFVEAIVPFYEDTCFQRNMYLVPGLKTINDDFTYVNNMRGEEIEIFGILDELKTISNSKNVAVILPGSHTHTTYIQDDKIIGIISNFSGELFHALRSSTILSPILGIDDMKLDKAMVKKGVENLKKFGFNRAIYISHSMRLFNKGTEAERFSYAEGVINGGVRESLEYYCENYWKECDTIALVADEFMYELYSAIFDGSDYIKEIIWLPISETNSYAVKGLKKMVSLRGDKYER